MCLASPADVIRLKNGKTIVTDSVTESNGRIEYTIGDNTFAIPRELVERIDTGPAAAVPAETRVAPSPAEVPQVREQLETTQELMAKVVHSGQVDRAAIRAIEDEGAPARSAAANFAAATFENKQSKFPEAARYLEEALHYEPDDFVLLESYAAVLLQLGRDSESLPYAQQATRSNPQSAEALAVLGYANYRNNHNREAIAAWKKSLALHSDPTVQELLARAERESTAEAEFREQESSHFVLHYEGSQAPDRLRDQVFKVLEGQYNTLQDDLGAAPRSSISVSLYTEQAFFDVTHAPAWTAALNDGKIRVPISGLTEVTPPVARVLRHELTHSFIAQITHGNVPNWLDEGVAQLEEPLSTSPIGKRLAALYGSGNQIPLNRLEHSFQVYSAEEADVAYAESLAAAECIRDNYGMSDVARILQRLGDGQPIESALRSTIHEGYAQLETELAGYLARRYGQ